MSVAVSHPLEFITSDPQIRSGRPTLRGRTLTVADIAIQKIIWQRTPEDITTYYDLSISEVYAALAYYYEHKTEIDADIRERDRLAREFKEQRLGSRHDSLLSR